MFVETHVHLMDAKFDEDRDGVLEAARRAGVQWFVEIAEEEVQWDKARQLAHAHQDIRWSVGLHPYYADRVDAPLLERMEGAASDPRCVAIGEIGLDYHRMDCPREVQRQALDRLLALAVRVGKPVVLHCRDAGGSDCDAQADMLSILARHFEKPERLQNVSHKALSRPFGPPSPVNGGGIDRRGGNQSGPSGSEFGVGHTGERSSPSHPRGVAHCFQGNVETARALIERGFMIGVDAPITYPKAEALRAMIAEIPLSALVLETDSPYLPPQRFRGQRNEPRHIPAIAEALALLKDVSVSSVSDQTTANARSLFRP